MFSCVIPSVMTLSAFLKCIIAALVLGILNSLVFSFKNKTTGTMLLTLMVLPAVVAMVIMMVNGNIGAGLGVAGAFSLVRFRSAPGNAKDILGIFICTAIGLTCGMGYLGIAVVFFLLIALVVLAATVLRIGEAGPTYRVLKITIPENLDYDGLFDDVFKQYTTSHELVKVKTTNMGTLFELTYDINLKSSNVSKQFLDDLRCRNGNLNVICSKAMSEEVL